MPKDSKASTVLAVLRVVREWSQRELAEAAGVRPSSISDWERGKKTPSPRTLERLAGAMGFSPAMVQRALAFVGDARQDSGPAVPGDLVQQVRALASEFGREVTDFLEAGLTRLTLESTALYERNRAPFLWSRLKAYGAAERRAVVQECEDFRSWGLCELLCEESEKAAPDSPARAVELADLALRIAGRVPGDERWRSQIQGYAWAFVGNARRVRGDLPGADEAFARSGELWQPSAGLALLDESRLLDLEASLRRDQRHFPESLKLLDRALALGKGEAAGRILIKKAKTLEELGDYESAVTALRRAAPLVNAEADPRLLLCLRFNLLVNLCNLDRHGEAAPWLPEVKDLTVRLGNELDLVRLRWLEGRIAYGQGRIEEAMIALRQVRAEFALRGIAYDTALVTLELSALLAMERRASEVKDLARHLVPIFQAQDVHREALAALTIFRKAAEEETLTAELARELLEFLQKARENPHLRFIRSEVEKEARERPIRPSR